MQMNLGTSLIPAQLTIGLAIPETEAKDVTARKSEKAAAKQHNRDECAGSDDIPP
jgi:hypothetical protein